MQTELRTQILVLLSERAASRPEIARELGADPDRVKYELKVLRKLELIEEVCREPVRGTTRIFYRTVKVTHLDVEEWAGVPDVIKGRMRGPLFRVLVDDARAAIEGNTFDSLEAAHMSWMPMLVDDQGWREIVELLDNTMYEVLRVRTESKERLLGDDAEGHSITVSMLGYGSYNEKRKVGPAADPDRPEDGSAD